MTWTNERKDLTREMPFHRVRSPWFLDAGEKGKLVTLSSGQQGLVVGADGKGYECGCRAMEDFPPGSLLGEIKLKLLQLLGAATGLGDPREVMHTLPGWVPVLNRNPLAPNPPDDVNNPTQVEFEGMLVRSYQTWTDAPGAQWHHWYDWNFLVVPRTEPGEGGYSYLRGAANTPPEEDIPDGFKALVGEARVMELEWDAGAIGAARPGPMFSGSLHKPDGSLDEGREGWFWPMKDHFLWGVGRWIYDCGHSRPPDDKAKGLMRTELHPMKAMASARWEAVKFEENTHFVPAIQFMFLAHRKAGYKEWKVINDVDYEFIVDLPKFDLPQGIDWQIGHTPEFPFNTGALRTPHLLKKVRFMEIPNLQTPGKVMPIVEPIKEKGDPADSPPTQVLVKVPCKQLPSSADYYGFVLSLGWHDPDKEQARKVKKVSVFLDRFRVGNRLHDTFPFQGIEGEWQLRFGVNGRWMETIIYDVRRNQTKEIQADSGKQFFEFHLAEDDALIVNGHGVEYDRVGDFMLENDVEARKVRKRGVPVEWETDIVVKDSNVDVLTETIDAVSQKMLNTFGVQNDPLGMIDPGEGPDAGDGTNPLTMKAVNEKHGGRIEDRPMRFRAPFTKEVGKLAELAENLREIDYILEFTLSVVPQKVD